MNVTPCGVLYRTLSDATGTRNYDEIDSRIISRTFFDDKGRSPYERIMTAGSYRTREIIQKDPRELDVRIFKNVHESCASVVSYLKSCGLDNRAITDWFSGDATDQLCVALREWGFEHHAFRNCMYDIVRSNDVDQLNTAMAVVMLFMTTAIHGDPKESQSSFYESLRKQAINITMETGMLSEDMPSAVAESYPLLGVIRRGVSSEANAHMYQLNPNPDGTLIGRTEIAEHSINDVGATVSRRHLLVFRQDAVWYARGLGSKNGTMVERADGLLECIELPSVQRDEGSSPRNVPIHAGDILKLGLDTEFVVIPLTGTAQEREE